MYEEKFKRTLILEDLLCTTIIKQTADFGDEEQLRRKRGLRGEILVNAFKEKIELQLHKNEEIKQRRIEEDEFNQNLEGLLMHTILKQTGEQEEEMKQRKERGLRGEILVSAFRDKIQTQLNINEKIEKRRKLKKKLKRLQDKHRTIN